MIIFLQMWEQKPSDGKWPLPQFPTTPQAKPGPERAQPPGQDSSHLSAASREFPVYKESREPGGGVGEGSEAKGSSWNILLVNL